MMHFCIAFFLAFVTCGLAHIAVTPSRFKDGSYGMANFRVGHGCGTEATTSVELTIPTGMITVRGEQNPAWTITSTNKSLTPEATVKGRTVNSTVDVMTFTFASPVPNSEFTSVGLTFYLQKTDDIANKLTDAEKKTANGYRTLLVPFRQICGNTSTNWNESPSADGSGPEYPAPALYITDDAALLSSDTSKSESTNSGVAIAALVLGILAFIFGFISIIAVRRLLNDTRALETRIQSVNSATAATVTSKA